MSKSAFYEIYGGSAPEAYERYFVPYIGRPFATGLIEAANLEPGERVLDVACGTGLIARLAAERVGTSGSVHGLDMNPGMLEMARVAAPADYPFEWHQGTAESMPLADEQYDVVLSQLGLQFMEDKLAALSEMHRVLAPGGRMLVSVTGPTPPPFALFADALRQHIDPQIASFVHAVFSLHDPDELESLLRAARFTDVRVETSSWKLQLAAPEEFMWQYVFSTPLSAAVMQADEANRTVLERDVVAGWQPYVEAGAMTLEPRMVLATARK